MLKQIMAAIENEIKNTLMESVSSQTSIEGNGSDIEMKIFDLKILENK